MVDFLIQHGYWGLFIATFLGATILPFSSDVIYVALLAAGLDIFWCTAIATVGNTLGGATNYFLGKVGKVEWIEKYLRIKKEKLEKMQKWLNGKGAYIGFFGFLPFVGDVMIVALGFMRANAYIVLLSMTVGKLVRYIVVGFATAQVMNII